MAVPLAGRSLAVRYAGTIGIRVTTVVIFLSQTHTGAKYNHTAAGTTAIESATISIRNPNSRPCMMLLSIITDATPLRPSEPGTSNRMPDIVTTMEG